MRTRKIARPRQIYLGHQTRDYVPLSERKLAGDRLLDHSSSDLLQELRANSAGDVKRIHARIELHDVRAHNRAFDPLNQIDRLARGHPAGSR